MEQNPKVSILVPFYNVEKYVGKCVESLFTQTYKNREYIFVNGKNIPQEGQIIRSKDRIIFGTNTIFVYIQIFAKKCSFSN